MIRSLCAVLLIPVVVVLSGGVAAADEPAEGSGYSCDALTSASVPAVKKRLAAQGIDVSSVSGPVGLSCRKADGEGDGDGDGDGVAVSVTGVDGVAYRCGSADEKSGTDVVFFVDCAPAGPVTG